ncbi:hypothetical protein [Methanolapillus ohkumae]|uniref:Uncharacterized protein n=1 Tax=Methanolapillus ohkumae TaxID=3028298 RepID=A0AA96VK14_9EURY|nr:hypothetical protein MsAm2_16260 [Methanosarcinaceae archaeon Am2]
MKKERGEYLKEMRSTNDKNIAIYLLSEIKTKICNSFSFYLFFLFIVIFPGLYAILELVGMVLSPGSYDSLFISLINYLMILFVIFIFTSVIRGLYDTYLLYLERQEMLKIFNENMDDYLNQENKDMRSGSNPYYKYLYYSENKEKAFTIIDKTRKWKNKSLLSSISLFIITLLCLIWFNFFVSFFFLIVAIWELFIYVTRSQEYKKSLEFFNSKWG